ESMIGKPVEAYYATRSAIQRAIDTKYAAQIGEEVDEAMEDVGVLNLNSSFAVQDIAGQGLDNAPVAKIVNMILDYAIKHHSSDVHIEPREGKISVRYRIHGILSEKLTLPNKLGPSIVSRIKILANMKIDEHRIPQDNRFQVRSGERLVDLRVSVMPAIYGEKVVMRLLEKGADVLSLEQTGLRGPAYKSYKDGLAKTQGILLITGPTGSGKTQTLASSLAILNTQEVNILTVEDPVEIRVDGVTQVQVNPEVGLTFASALRAFLRQDPDIIMVGEIRDAETADLAVQAALTGHLVLATLHTNSAAGALPRLLDMGVQPFLLSSTINVIVAQRLVRRLCDDCKQPVESTEEEMRVLHESLDPLHGLDLKESSGEMLHFDSNTTKVKLYKPVGCPKCADSGYQGRIGIFELMTVTEKIGKMIMGHQSAAEISAQAQQDGMLTMVQDGYIKALDGMTTISEVLRVQNV
ncbi:type II/IV secretion system protein, partial [Candidatus Dojkabacteria bacterium]|nr:type II/IV secretion system protein [Candidatus Dojkabacteria bacterium]